MLQAEPSRGNEGVLFANKFEEELLSLAFYRPKFKDK